MAPPRPRPVLAWIPNALTAARLVIALAFPVAPAPWRLPLVLTGGLSDALDGFLARRFGVTSWTGALLDAVADKLFTLAVLVTFALDGLLAPWAVALMLSRDLAVALMAAYGALRREWWGFKQAAARWPGKVTTIALFAAMLALLLIPAHARWFVCATILLSAAAAADYLAVFIAARRRGPPPLRRNS